MSGDGTSYSAGRVGALVSYAVVANNDARSADRRRRPEVDDR